MRRRPAEALTAQPSPIGRRRRAEFPAGTTGAQLDVLARTPLWEVGLDYGHGTGHGVGCYMNVHEGPQGISPRSHKAALDPGMIVSNEPGLYLAGEYGIRIENLMLVVERRAATSESAAILGFDDLTLVPYCRRLIDADQLSPEDRVQLNAYHARVAETLGPLLDAETRSWLERETAPV